MLFCGLRNKRYDEIDKVYNYNDRNIDRNKLSIIGYLDLIKNYDIATKYYLCTDRQSIVSFDILSIDKMNDCECQINSLVYYFGNIQYKVTMKMTYTDDLDDAYNVACLFKVLDELFNDVYIDFDEYCSINILLP
ncbi:MAG: hypothetical protein Barrevirus6_5 [Barrevirus sp.]|uniref:Uncharacterized protein n=1 Tax=Barrevirus sp. TaxID=2487763 RepID=A0A3G4ZQ03_9VIRU|nr:MAG: hypothetical protein Barrevirus6_5 [Barrevirus sp.]